MYILQAFCALAIASLCTDVEAKWNYWNGLYRWYTSEKKADQVMKFDDADVPVDRTYTGSETVYFKVTSDSSPITIKNIKVAVKSGNFLLSAESATSNICSGQTSECLGPKQIQEKVFFITVKPNPEFTNGELTLELAQAGKIYLINHEGARLYGNNAVRLYSGYHPVMLPRRLPQYKITCNGNCKISQNWGFGSDYNIALSRYPLERWTDGCPDCICATGKDGQKVHCQTRGSSSFNIGGSFFYIALVPLKEGKVVTDAEFTIEGGDFKSVEKLDHDVMRSYIFTQRTYTEALLFKVTCASKCTIKKIEVNGVKNGGNFLLSAESSTKKICSDQTSKCLGTIQINETEFTIEVKPNPSFTNGHLTVDLDDKPGTIYERANAQEGARLYNKNDVLIYYGDQPVKFPQVFQRYKITCDGNCKNLRIQRIGNKIVVAASEKPVLEKQSGCFNCFCVSSAIHGVCGKRGNYVFNLQSNSFYITLVPDPEAKDVWAHVSGSNLKGVTKINCKMLKNGLKINGKPGALYHFPAFQGTSIQDLTIEFIPDRDDRRFYAEILTGAEVKAIFVSHTDVNHFDYYCKKNCTNCSCNTRKGCESFIAWMDQNKDYNPTFLSTKNYVVFHRSTLRVRVVLKARKGGSTAYLRVSGNKFKELKKEELHFTCSPLPTW